MNAFQKRITWRVLGIHVAIIFLVAIVPFMRGCFTPKPKEIVTFIEFENPGPTVSVDPSAHMEDPEPPAPEPPPERIPEPVKKKPVPIKKKPEPIKKKPEPVKKTEPKKPKWKPTKVDPTKSKRIEATPKKPMVSSKEISDAFKGITSKPSRSSGDPNRFSYYYSQVMAKLHAVWVPPSTVSAISRPAEVRFSIRSNGAVTARGLSVSSGNSVFDQTVMKAANSVGMLPKPPSDYNFNYVIVPFDMPK